MWLPVKCGGKSFLDKMEDGLRGVQDPIHKRILVRGVEFHADWVIHRN